MSEPIFYVLRKGAKPLYAPGYDGTEDSGLGNAHIAHVIRDSDILIDEEDKEAFLAGLVSYKQLKQKYQGDVF